MLSVPLATAGGVFGLALLNLYRFQPLDMLTMLGFVILIGIVVNNAILLVHQPFIIFAQTIWTSTMPSSRQRETGSTNIHVTLTSVFGMLPLVLIPGAGSELYSGLGSVVLGGLSLSAVLTLAIIPPLLAIIAGSWNVIQGYKKSSSQNPAEYRLIMDNLIIKTQDASCVSHDIN